MTLEVVCLPGETRFSPDGDQYYDGELPEGNHDCRDRLPGWDCSGVDQVMQAQSPVASHPVLSPLNGHSPALLCVGPHIL